MGHGEGTEVLSDMEPAAAENSTTSFFISMLKKWSVV